MTTPSRWLTVWCCLAPAMASAAEPFDSVETRYRDQARSLLKTYCLDCHSSREKQGELDLERFATLADIRRDPQAWQKVAEMLDTREMPPRDAPQPSTAEKARLREWVRTYLDAEARASAGDPGPVPLRRLSNAEYTWTIRDLTGVDLSPAREFPADGAAGEGFTNAGAAGAMSPALLQKYFDAAKDVAAHAVLLPQGIRFSPSTSRRDWTEEALAEIHRIYDRDTSQSGATAVNLQGIRFETNGGGRLAIEKYLAATLEERAALQSGQKSIEQVARERAINPRYLGLLWQALSDQSRSPSLLIDALRGRWKGAGPGDVAAMMQEIDAWQRSLFRFTSIGHIGKKGGPTAWMESISPLAARQELRQKLIAVPGRSEVTLYLSTSDAGDGPQGDFVVWDRPRLVAPGRPEFLLKDLPAVSARLRRGREQLIASAGRCLTAAAEAATLDSIDLPELSRKHDVEPEVLSAWLDYLGIGATADLGTPISRTLSSASNYDFIKGWVGDQALSVLANSSDQPVRIPGNMKPHGVAVHPSPTVQVGLGWKAQSAGRAQVSATIQHAHPECGNGVVWSLEVRRGRTIQRLANGVAHGGKPVQSGTLEDVALRPSDVIALVIGPRDGNHSCDLTAVDLRIQVGDQKWDLAAEVSPDILAGNPHADGRGNPGIWHFFSEPVSGGSGPVIPAGSLLAGWQSADHAGKARIASELQSLLAKTVEDLPAEAPDTALYRQLTSLNGPLAGALLRRLSTTSPGDAATPAPGDLWGVDSRLFGRHPDGSAVDPASVCVQAPTVIPVRIPAELADGAELVATCSLHEATGRDGSVQVQVLATPPQGSSLTAGAVQESQRGGAWTSSGKEVAHSTPILTQEGSSARHRFEQAFTEFRDLFPPALCYSKIVPVDEVVTLTLFYREDEPLRRLMLTDAEASRLDAVWDELHFIGRDPLTLVDAFRQLMEFATQDGDPSVFEPLRKPIMDRADRFRQQQLDAEPHHVNAVVEFASRAWRRPLSSDDEQQLRSLYQRLRKEELPHEDAVRLLVARVLVAPDFLYRMEVIPAGRASAPVSGHEVATRLSYFLWSSAPDEELRRAAAAGELQGADGVAAQARRMLADPKVRRLATEFGCQWLHVYDFDQLNEKSERHFRSSSRCAERCTKRQFCSSPISSSTTAPRCRCSIPMRPS